MSDTDGEGEGRKSSSPAEEAALAARLKRLGEAVNERRPAERAERPDIDPATASASARGMRLASEFVAGILVGAAIGWGVDTWVGTSPWGLIVFVLFGFAAGALNAMRAAGTSVPKPPAGGDGKDER